jgi:hypothetical protein
VRTSTNLCELGGLNHAARATRANIVCSIFRIASAAPSNDKIFNATTLRYG